MLRSLLAAALILLVLVVPVEAKKPPRQQATLAAATFAVVTADATDIHAGDTVTFTATTDSAWWKHEIRCYQSGKLVILGGWTYYPPGTASVTVGMTSRAYQANPVGADCEAWVVEWVGFTSPEVSNPTVDIPEPLRFPLLP